MTGFLHLRRWRRHPLLAAHHVITISVGMAAVTAVVSLMLAMAFAPLPFRDYGQLVQVWHRVESGAPIDGLSGNDLTAIQDGADGIFSAVGGYMNLILWARDEGKVTGPLRAVRMEPSAFRALDLTPVIGRPIDGDSANAGSVWIGHSLWQSRYGGRTTVIGEKIRWRGTRPAPTKRKRRLPACCRWMFVSRSHQASSIVRSTCGRCCPTT